MRILLFFIFFFCVVIYIRNYPFDITSRRVLSLYVGLWSISLFFALCEFGGLHRITTDTIFLIYLSIVSFVCGFSLSVSKRYTDKHINYYSLGEIINTFSKLRYFRIVLITLLCYVIGLFVTYIDTVILYGNLVGVRDEYFGGDEAGLYGPLYDVINLWLLTPFSIIVIPIFIYKLFYSRDWVCLLSGLFLIIYFSLGGGRFGYIRILLGIVFVIYCLLYNDKKYPNKRFKNKIIKVSVSVAIVFVFLLSIVTAARSQDFEYGDNMLKQGTEEFINSTVVYMGGAIVAFDKCVSENYLDKIDGYQYGKLTMRPLVFLISPLLNKLGAGYLESADISFKQDEGIQVSSEVYSFNALYTALFWFYLDFGMLGIIIFPFIFGLLLRWAILLMTRRFNMANLVLVSFLFLRIMHFVFDYSFVTFQDLLFFIALYCIGNYNKNVTISC